jgi:hypothetical protein
VINAIFSSWSVHWHNGTRSVFGFFGLALESTAISPSFPSTDLPSTRRFSLSSASRSVSLSRISALRSASVRCANAGSTVYFIDTTCKYFAIALGFFARSQAVRSKNRNSFRAREHVRNRNPRFSSWPEAEAGSGSGVPLHSFTVLSISPPMTQQRPWRTDK